MDNVKQRVTVKLIPRIDLQAIANKMVNSFHFLEIHLFRRALAQLEGRHCCNYAVLKSPYLHLLSLIH